MDILSTKCDDADSAMNARPLDCLKRLFFVHVNGVKNFM